MLGRPLGIAYGEYAGVRFYAPFSANRGRIYEYVLLFAEDLGDGRYHIGSTRSEFFATGQREIPLWHGFLRRVPAPGELVDDWLTDFTEDEWLSACATAYRFLLENGIDGDVMSIVHPGWYSSGRRAFSGRGGGRASGAVSEKERITAAVLLGIALAVCIAHYALSQSPAIDKWAMATIASLVGFCAVLARIVGGRR